MHYLQSPHVSLLSPLFGEADNECISSLQTGCKESWFYGLPLGQVVTS